MNENTYIIVAKSPVLEINSNDYGNYITTNDDFKKFCNDIFDLEAEKNDVNPVFQRYVKKVYSANTVYKTFIEDRDAEGFKKKVLTKRGNVRIGYSRIRVEYIYVEHNGLYYRGFRVFFANLCLANANKYTPLDKNYGNGNVEIILWNKRHFTKAIKYINNKLQTIMYCVDKIFYSLEEAEQDMKNPSESNLGKVIETML